MLSSTHFTVSTSVEVSRSRIFLLMFNCLQKARLLLKYCFTLGSYLDKVSICLLPTLMQHHMNAVQNVSLHTMYKLIPFEIIHQSKVLLCCYSALQFGFQLFTSRTQGFQLLLVPCYLLFLTLFLFF